MVYRDFKDLTRSTAFDYKEFSIAKNPKYDGYETGVASIVYKFFDKNTSDGAIKNENISNKKTSRRITKTIY